jgi:uncharacterized protein YydD (DUF2326 family)
MRLHLMKLNNFLLEIDGKTIRDITFEDNLNIIINDKSLSMSGNSVGKSTLGRILDYLFDGSIKDIYVDRDNDSTNKEIENLFNNHKVYASLTYSGLDGLSSTIKRQLSIGKNSKNYFVNGVSKSSKEYISHIMKTIFNVFSNKPTIRKLAPKFFRTNQYRMLHNTKLLDEYSKSSKSDFSIVMLYLFGFESTTLLTDKHDLNLKITKYKKQTQVLGSIIKDDKIKGAITEIKRRLAILEKGVLSTDKGVDKLVLVSKINEIDDKENKHIDLLINLDVKIKNVQRTNEILNNDDRTYLVSELQRIYEYASVSIDSVIRDYDDSLEFHKQLIETKKEFLSSGLPALEKIRKETELEVQQLRSNKSSLYAQISSKQNINELSATVKEIGTLTKELINNTAIIDKQEATDLNLKNTSNLLTELLEKLTSQLKCVNDFESKFIENFKIYTNELYGVEYNFSLNLDDEKGECDPSVDETQSNNEGGLKRLEIILFDLAYIKTISDMESNRPSFVVHDSVDDIDSELIVKMFNISQSLSGQQIVSVLADKLSDEQYKKYKPFMILELSQNNKFFEINS